jgi:WD40 repeat protein
VRWHPPKCPRLATKDKIHISNDANHGAVIDIEAPGENTLLALNQNGSWLASTDSLGLIHIWKYEDGTFTSISSAIKEQADSMSFNPDGSLLAVGAAQDVFLIDTASGNEIARIPHWDVVTGVAFSLDGKYLATTSSNVLQLWNAEKIQKIKSGDELIQTACSRLTGKFSKAELQILLSDSELICKNFPITQ